MNGESYSSIAEIASDFDLTSTQLSSRLETMTLEEAVNYIPSNGRYSESRFKSDTKLAKTVGSLYFIKIISSDGTLHKIRITARAVGRRFSSIEYELIEEYTGTLCDLYRVEQRVMTLFSDKHYRGDDDFDGRTETFLLMDEEELEMQEAIAFEMEQFESRKYINDPIPQVD